MEVLGDGNRSGLVQSVVTTRWRLYSLKLVYKANGWTDFHDSNGKWKDSRGAIDEPWYQLSLQQNGRHIHSNWFTKPTDGPILMIQTANEGTREGESWAVVQTIVTTRWPPDSLELVYKANGWTDFHDSNGKWADSREGIDQTWSKGLLQQNGRHIHLIWFTKPTEPRWITNFPPHSRVGGRSPPTSHL